MFAALAVAATLLIAQPFSVVMQAVGLDGEVHTFMAGSFPDRASCEAARVADREALAAKDYILQLNGEMYRAIGSACVVRGGVAA